MIATSEIKNSTPTPKAQLRQLVPRLLWIIFGAFIFALLAMKSYSGVPLLLGALIATALYKFTKRLVSGRRIEVRVVAWIIFVVLSFSIYNTIWWQWGPAWMRLKWWWAETQWLLGDRTGGKTPQETYVLFSRAVAEGNFEQASKYIARSYRSNPERWLDTIHQKRQAGTLQQYIEFLQRPWSEYEELDPKLGRKFIYYDPETEKMFLRAGTLATSSYTLSNVAGAPGDGRVEYMSYSGDTILFVYNKATRRWKIALIQCDTCAER